MGVFEGRSAIVTGAAQGLGWAVASRLHAEGARVMLADIQGEKVTAAAQRLDASGRTATGHMLDASSAAAANAMVEAAQGAFGGLDMLVNVAGGSGMQRVERIEDMTDDIFDKIVGNNLRATFLCSRAAAPMLRKRGGAIVNFATGSIRGFSGRTTSSAPLAYVSAKAGIIGFTNQLAADMRGDNVAVSVIQPGFVLTEPGARIHTIFQSMPKADQDAMLKGRDLRPPQEIGWAVAYMASRGMEITATAVRLQGPIQSLNLKLVRDPEGPLASTGYLEAAG
jgi:3-oxoacyl-[acyl-carrier protein] reductase